MDAARALADLTEISSQVEAAVFAAEDGTVLASTLADGDRAGRFAAAALRLLDEAASTATGPAGVPPVQLHAATSQGSVFVVREGPRLAAATTGAEASVGLVLYDLRSALRSIDEEPKQPKPRRKPRAKAAAPKPKPKPKPEAGPRGRRKKPEQEGEDGAA